MSPTSLRKNLLRHLRLKESWVIFFILGLIMLNYPFIKIFNRVDPFLGFPLLYLYLQAGWVISIFVIYLFTKAIPPQNDKDEKGES